MYPARRTRRGARDGAHPPVVHPRSLLRGRRPRAVRPGLRRDDLFAAGHRPAGHRAGLHQLRQLLLRAGSRPHPHGQHLQGLRRLECRAALQLRLRGRGAGLHRAAAGVVPLLRHPEHRIGGLHLRAARPGRQLPGARPRADRGRGHGACGEPLPGVVHHLVPPGAGRQGLLCRHLRRTAPAPVAAGLPVHHLDGADYRHGQHPAPAQLHAAAGDGLRPPQPDGRAALRKGCPGLRCPA